MSLPAEVGQHKQPRCQPHADRGQRAGNKGRPQRRAGEQGRQRALSLRQPHQPDQRQRHPKQRGRVRKQRAGQKQKTGRSQHQSAGQQRQPAGRPVAALSQPGDAGQRQPGQQGVNQPRLADAHAQTQQQRPANGIFAKALAVVIQHKRRPEGNRQRRSGHTEPVLGKYLGLKQVGYFVF